MKIEVVARPEEVHEGPMPKRLVCLTDPETARETAPDPLLRANRNGGFSPEKIAHLDRLGRLPPIIFPEASEHYIYVIGPERGPVKVGVSCNPLMRMRQLQSSTPVKLELLAWAPGSYEIEKELHAFYRRERLTGEWFKRTKRVGELIDGLNAISGS